MTATWPVETAAPPFARYPFPDKHFSKEHLAHLPLWQSCVHWQAMNVGQRLYPSCHCQLALYP